MAWGMFPCALSAWLAAHMEAVAGEPKRHGSLSSHFWFTFVVAQAAASTVGLWGVLRGPGVSPLAGDLALVPIAVAVWCLLALPFALHVAFARRCVTSANRVTLAMRRALSGGWRRFRGSPVAVLVGPAAWTAVWTAIGELSPLGAFPSPAASQARDASCL